MTSWIDDYASTDDPDERYKILRNELTRLRAEVGGADRFDPDAVADTLRRLNDEVAGDLVVFVANDFGQPRAHRPEGSGFEVQDAVRRAILDRKYDDSNPDLDELRQELLDDHPGIHTAIVAVFEDSSLRYHLPEGSNQNTNFLTVREMVGLIDYTTNSFQNEGLSRTY